MASPLAEFAISDGMIKPEEEFLYLTTLGRLTGEPRQIEIWFVEREGHYYVVSELRNGANWVKNIKKVSKVQFSVGLRANRKSSRVGTRAKARLLEDDEDRELICQVCDLMDAKYGWSNGLVVEVRPIRTSTAI